MCYVYLLRSISDPTQTYTGFTRDLRHRLTQHNCGHSTHTRKFMPWELVFYAAFQEEVAARKFESYLKSGSGRAFAHKRLLSGIRGGVIGPIPRLHISSFQSIPSHCTRGLERKFSRAIILLGTIAEARTCDDIPWEPRPSLA
jgi:predicted GIY-YIG superfamily endonuclease